MSQLSDNLAYTEAYYKVIWYIHVIYCIIKLHENYHIPIHTAIPVHPAQPKFAKLEKKGKFLHQFCKYFSCTYIQYVA